MNWLIFALLSPAIYTLVVYIDRYIVEREIPRPRAMAIYSSLVAIVFGTIFFALSGFQALPLRDALLVMLSGAFTTFAVILYFEAITRAQTSNVIVLFQMVPVLVLIFSFVFLDERITTAQSIGFVLILAASVIVSIEAGGGGIRLSHVFFLVLGVDLLWAATNIIFKFVSYDYAFLPLAAYESWGLAAGGLLLFVFAGGVRRAFLESLQTVRRRAFGVIGLNETLFVIAKLAGLLAIALGPVSLVSVLGGTQVFFGILAGWGLTLIAPAIFKEDIRQGTLLRKGLLSVVVLGGIWLVS